MVIRHKPQARHTIFFLTAAQLFPPILRLEIHGAKRDQELVWSPTAFPGQGCVGGRNWTEHSIETACPSPVDAAAPQLGYQGGSPLRRKFAKRPTTKPHVGV